jgi:hypothetical protein
MTTMDFDFTTKEGRLNAAREFADEFKQHITEDGDEAINVSYSDDEHILTNGAATPKDLEGFIIGMLHDMPKLLALILLRRTMQRLTEDDSEN